MSENSFRMDVRELRSENKGTSIKCTHFRFEICKYYARFIIVPLRNVSSARASFAEYISPAGSSIGRWDSHCRFPATPDSSLGIRKSRYPAEDQPRRDRKRIVLRAILTDEEGRAIFWQIKGDARFREALEFWKCNRKYNTLKIANILFRTGNF